jgi:hypothetical protein
MKNYLPRIAGSLLLVCAFVLLVTAPPKEQFSIANLFFFLACLVFGYLLLAGYIGTHPIAAGLRREPRPDGPARTGPLCYVHAQTFPFSTHSKSRMILLGLCVLMGLAMFALGWFVAHAFPTGGIWIGMPLFLGAAICVYSPLRHWSMYVKLDPQGITARLYFRKVAIRWEDVVALIARKHSVLLPGAGGLGAFGQLGIIYSIYSHKSKIDFTQDVPEADRLISILTAATGLKWQ